MIEAMFCSIVAVFIVNAMVLLFIDIVTASHAVLYNPRFAVAVSICALYSIRLVLACVNAVLQDS